MDLDKAVISAILSEGKPALDKALQLGISPVRLHGEGKAAWEFITDYFRRHGSMPVAGMIRGKIGVEIDEDEIFALEDVPDRSASFFIEEINNRYLGSKIRAGLDKVIKEQESRAPVRAYEELEKLIADIRSEQIGNQLIDGLWKQGPEVLAYYERIKSGERGILSPWPSINEATFGFWPEDLILFVARAGVGKTWAAVHLALHAWITPKPQTGARQRVLFITTEVSKMRIGMRFMAAHLKLPYGELTHGRMSFINEHKLKEAIDRYYDDEFLKIIGGDFDFRMESVEDAVDKAKPDLVIIDGVYLLRVAGNNRTERMANAFDECKRLAKRKKVPVVISTQFNREVKKDIAKTVQIESIAMSDVGSWNADLAFGLLQTDEMRAQKQLTIKPLKIREGDGHEVTVNWDFDRMNFSELNGVGGGGGDADEKGTSLDNDVQQAEDDDLPF